MMNDADPPNDSGDPLPPPRMLSGKWILSGVLILSVGAAAFGWLWTYNNQRRPREYWGYYAWVLIGRGQYVTAVKLDPEPAPQAGKPLKAWYDKLLVVPLDPTDGDRYVVVDERRVEKSPGLSIGDQSSSLREALAFHRSFLWDSKAAELQRPKWRYALTFSDEQAAAPPQPVASATAAPSASPTPSATYVASQPPPKSVTILFDAECRFVRPQIVDHPMALDPRTAEQFNKFFETTFAAQAK
jgi:hypothetical protein